MKRGSRLGGLLALATATLLLAGCAAPTTAPIHAPVSPTPTKTPTAMSKPGSRVPVGCAGLLPQTSWQALAGTAATVDLDENAVPTDMWSAAQLQFGALTCIWDGTRTSSATNPGANLTVVVAPDSKAAFESGFEATMTSQPSNPHPPATEGVAGDKSGYWCATNLDAGGADFNLAICDGELRVSNYWVSIQVDTVNGLSRAQLTSGLATAMTDISTRLAAARPPRPQWAAPAIKPPGFCTDSTSTASVQAIVGDRTLVPYPSGSRVVLASTVGLVGRYVYCLWNSRTYGSVGIDLLVGGSWVFPGFTPVVVGDSLVRSYGPVTVPGASSAVLGCAQGSCDSYLAVGTTLVRISLKDAGRAKNVAVLGAFAKSIAAS